MSRCGFTPHAACGAGRYDRLVHIVLQPAFGKWKSVAMPEGFFIEETVM